MTTQAIIESGMTFGPYPAGQCFYIEKTHQWLSARSCRAATTPSGSGRRTAGRLQSDRFTGPRVPFRAGYQRVQIGVVGSTAKRIGSGFEAGLENVGLACHICHGSEPRVSATVRADSAGSRRCAIMMNQQQLIDIDTEPAP